MHKPIPSVGAFNAIKNSFPESNFLKGSNSRERPRIRDSPRAPEYGEASGNTENFMDSHKEGERSRDFFFAMPFCFLPSLFHSALQSRAGVWISLIRAGSLSGEEELCHQTSNLKG